MYFSVLTFIDTQNYFLNDSFVSGKGFTTRFNFVRSKTTNEDLNYFTIPIIL